jgi:hypothetical protein
MHSVQFVGTGKCIDSSSKFVFDFRLSPWNEYYFLVFGFLHGVRGEFIDDVSETAGHEAAPNSVAHLRSNS